MKRRLFVGPAACTTIAIAMFCFLLADVRGQQESKPVPTGSGDDLFKDKIVLLEVLRSESGQNASGCVALTNARVTKFGDIDFIVGDGYVDADEKETWYKDMTIGFRCDRIIRFHAMTAAKYKEFFKSWRDQNEQMPVAH